MVVMTEGDDGASEASSERHAEHIGQLHGRGRFTLVPLLGVGQHLEGEALVGQTHAESSHRPGPDGHSECQRVVQGDRLGRNPDDDDDKARGND